MHFLYAHPVLRWFIIVQPDPLWNSKTPHKYSVQTIERCNDEEWQSNEHTTTTNTHSKSHLEYRRREQLPDGAGCAYKRI